MEFVLAEALGMTLSEVRELPSLELEEWRAFYKVRQVVQEHEAKKGG